VNDSDPNQVNQSEKAETERWLRLTV
jgi:hypothetical protein